MAELRRKWRTVKFGDVVRLNKETSKDPAADGLERYIGLEHLEPGDLRVRSWGDIADGTTFTNRARPGHVLFGKRRAYQRKVAVADFDGVCSGDIYVLEPKDSGVLLPELLPFLCQTNAFFEHAVGTSAGSLSPRTNWKSLATYEFALPPLEEQRRIVRLLARTSLVHDQVDHLFRAAENLLNSSTDALLKAVRGEAKPIGTLVDEGAIDRPQDGNHGGRHPKARDFVAHGVPFLMASDFCQGTVDLNECKFLSPEHAGDLRPAFRSVNGDVLLTHKGTLGETAILANLTTDYVMLSPQVTYYRIKDGAQLLPRFLFYVFRSSAFIQQLQSYGRQSTRAFVSISAQRRIQIPWPGTKKQDEIVKTLDQIYSSVELARSRRSSAKELLDSQIQTLLGADDVQ